ncbi:putative serine/threonine protein phosphatase [Dimargaris cristalligena]|nr:putative serine/threonine protein phosphatase [Dimargaris cristalligena]
MHDVDEYIACLHRGQILPPRAVRNLCDAITEILFAESNVVQVDSPVTVVGDIHGECQAKYNGSNAEWNYFVEAFNFLPLAAVIANCIFCVHGGPMCDLVWSDPDHTIQNYNVNSRFLQANGMDTILRAHQLCQGGYEIDHQLHGRFLTFHAAARSLEESQAVQMFPPHRRYFT